METHLIKQSKNVLANGLMVIFIGIYLAVTPFDYMVNVGAFSQATKLAMLGIIIFFILDNLLSNQAKIKLEMTQQKETKKITNLMFILYIYMCLTIFISNIEKSKTIEMLSIFVQSFVFLFIVLNIKLEKKDIRRIENIWLVLTGLFSILMTIYNIYNSDRTKLIIMHGTTDPNFYCATLIGPFIIGVSRILDKKVGKKRIGVIAILISMILMVMISGSRGSLAGIIIGVFVYLFMHYKEQNRLKKIIIPIFIAIFSVLLITPYISKTTLERYSIEGIFSNGGSGRVEIWETAFNYFKESPINNKLLGNGIGTYRYTAGEQIIVERYGHLISRDNMFSHNIIITVFIEGGIIGLIIMFLLLKEIISSAYKSDKFPFCLMLGILVAGMFIDITYLRIFWTVIGFVIIYIKSYDIGEKNGEESEHSSTSI